MRLIDANELKKALYDFLSENSTTCDWEDIFNVIDNAPTVEPFEPDYVGADMKGGDINGIK